MTEGTGLDAIERHNLVFALLAIAASALLASERFTVSVVTGVGIEAVNYRVLRRATQRLFSGRLAGGGPWSAGYALRFLFVGAAMAVSLAAGADPVGLVIGLSTVVPAAVVAAWREQPAPASPSALPAPPPDHPSWDRWDPWRARERDDDEEHDA